MKKKNKYTDLCPICEENLYFNRYFTKRIGLIDTNNKKEMLGWACPFCKSEFDIDDKLMYIYGEDFDAGNA